MFDYIKQKGFAPIIYIAFMDAIHPKMHERLIFEKKLLRQELNKTLI